MSEPSSETPSSHAADWPGREAYWRRRLGRLKLGVEPLLEQLNRYRRVNTALTIVTGVVAVFFAALFTAFAAPALGLVIAGLIFLPVTSMAWMDYIVLRGRARAYERERESMAGTREDQR
jgi:hypothetical protein